MAKHRWMKFWPQDWLRDPGLRCCSPAARGLWIDLISVMHEAMPYGHLTINGKPATAKQIGIIVGVPESGVVELLTELEVSGVFSRGRRGVIFSRRMVKDHEVSDSGRESAVKRWTGEPDLNSQQPTDKTINHPNGSNDGLPHGLPNGLPEVTKRQYPNSLETDTDSPESERKKESANADSSAPLVSPQICEDAGGEPRKISRRRPVKPLSAIPSDWWPNEAGIAWATEHKHPCDAAAVAHFRDWYTAAGKGQADWNATWRNWCRNGERFGRTANGLQPKPSLWDQFETAPSGADYGDTIIDGEICDEQHQRSH